MSTVLFSHIVWPIAAVQSVDVFETLPVALQILLGCGTLLVVYAILAAICWFLSSCLKALPPEHRQQDPGMVWLLLIPLFNFVWIFFVFPQVADSFRSYFTSLGRMEVGDCGRGVALAYCIVHCGMLVVQCIPCINILGGLAVLVLLILVLVKFAILKGQIQNPPPSIPGTPTV